MFFLIIWGTLNLLQAIFTPLHNDEAYYWMYSRYPAWGYYDHPPMIALMIGIGYSIFHNELGVRLLIVFSQLAALAMIWYLTTDLRKDSDRSPVIFMMLVAMMPILNVYAFIATPDAPLILFSALFLFAYKRFVEKETISDVILLGLSMAALAYSKYHGGLLVILVMLSNIKLLTNRKFYLAASIALILFLPHILWQLNNDFPSFRYHLDERASGFELANVPEYILNQLIIHNPVLIVAAVWLIIKKRPGSLFERSLYFIIAGFLIFFFISSFRYHVEPHWTALISIPLVILLFTSPVLELNSGKLLKWTAIFILPLIFIARLSVVFDILPVSYLKSSFHYTKDRMNDIREVAGSRPVVFTNSFQEPSQYRFYTGHFAHTLNSLSYRRTQYDIWDFEERLNGKEVFYVPHWLSKDYKKSLTGYVLPDGDTLFARVFNDFQSLQRQCIKLEKHEYSFAKETFHAIQISLFNPYPYAIRLDHGELPLSFKAAFFREGVLVSESRLTLPDTVRTIGRGDTIQISCQFYAGELLPGKYRFAITSEAGILYNVLSSRFSDAVITD